MVTELCHTHDPNFGSLSWFLRCKEHPCPLSPLLGLWRMLEVPDWGLAPLSWFGYGHWSLIYPWSEFWLFYPDFKGANEHPCPLSHHLGLLRMLEVPDWGLACWPVHTLQCTLYTVHYVLYRPEFSTQETNTEGRHIEEIFLWLIIRLGLISSLGKLDSISIIYKNCY